MKKKPKTIQHGKESESYYCRTCNYCRGINIKSGALARAKYHNSKTGHTVDVYYETWREITNNYKIKT